MDREAFLNGVVDELEKIAIKGKPLGRSYSRTREKSARTLLTKYLKGRRAGGAHPKAGKSFAKKSLERVRLALPQ